MTETELWGKKEKSGRSEDIIKELQINKITNGLPDYWNKWCEHIERIPENILNYGQEEKGMLEYI
jgi:hypothetical protein